MTLEVQCVTPGQPVAEAARILRDLDVGALPVCEDDRLVGMVTDRDIVVRAVADGQAHIATVRDVMSPAVISAFPEQDVIEAAFLMEMRQIRRLPVTDGDRRLIGIVSLGDIALRAKPVLTGHALKEISKSPFESRDSGAALMPAAT